MSAPDTPAIEFAAVSRAFGRVRAVDDLSLRIPRGVVYGFLGPNGAGKTTSIRLLVGLLRPDSGHITVCGADVVREPLRAKAAIGYAPDEPALYEALTLREFLQFSGSLYGLDEGRAAHAAREWIARLDLAGREDEMLGGYSHGMRQKASLAAALLHDPDVLVLDEPTVGLEPRAARLVKDLVRERAARGRTVFLTTHILEVAERVCDRVAVIRSGRLLVQGTVEDLRRAAGSRTDATLEDVFLSLTAQEDDRGIVDALDA